MSLIRKDIKVGNLYISDMTLNMALDCDGEIISDQDNVWDILEENRIPVKVQFEITEKCNFNCYYCYAKSLRNQKDLSIEEIKKVIDKLDKAGVVFLELTGGEPLAREDFLEILRYINEKEFILSFITNGSNFNREIIDELKKGNVDRIRLSLLSPTEESCDNLTNLKGSFKKTIEAAKLLKDSGLNFFVTSVITKENINMYEEYKKLEKEIGLEINYSIDVGPSFTGYKTVEQYGLTDEDIEKIRLYADVECYKNSEAIRCSAGQTKFAIDNQGNIMPCLKIRNIVGNILNEDFNEIWNSSILKEVMDSELIHDPKCEKCEKKNYCQAYCPGEYKLFESYETRCRTANLIEKLIED